MRTSTNIKLKHFSDILCIWAYIGQIRLDKLKIKFTNEIEIDYHFIQVFGAVENKMKETWGAKGGISAYAEHVKDVASKYPHVIIHPELWSKNIPSSSASCHVFLKAIQLLAEKDELTLSFDNIVW